MESPVCVSSRGSRLLTEKLPPPFAHAHFGESRPQAFLDLEALAGARAGRCDRTARFLGRAGNPDTLSEADAYQAAAGIRTEGSWPRPNPGRRPFAGRRWGWVSADSVGAISVRRRSYRLTGCCRLRAACRGAPSQPAFERTGRVWRFG